jgi:hypothetical protein
MWTLFIVTWPFVGWWAVFASFKPKTYVGFFSCAIWGIILGWYAVFIAAVIWLGDRKFWSKKLPWVE